MKVRSIMPKENASARRLIHDPNLDPEAFFIEFPLEDDFEDQDMEYFVSGEDSWPMAKEVGEALIRGAVPSLKMARIGFMWKRRGGSRGNKAILGKAVLANPLAFAAEVSRYGLWKPDLKIAKDAFEQMPLF